MGTIDWERTGRRARIALAATAALSLAACATAKYAGQGPVPESAEGKPTSRYAGYKVGQPYQVRGAWYTPREQPAYDEIGVASWYGEQFHNRYTADGEVFDMAVPSAAHKTLPLPSLVEVTNLANGRTLVVRVNDRGPFVDGRVIDLSREAASELGFAAAGLTRVRVRYVGRAPDPPGGVRTYQASAKPPQAPVVRAVQLAQNQVVQTTAQASVPAAGQVAPQADIQPTLPPAVEVADEAPAMPTTVVDAAPPVEAAAAPVAPAPISTAAPTAESDPPPPLAGPGFLVQAGAYSSRASAERVAESLADAGEAEVRPVTQGGRTLYRVVLKGFASEDQALAARGQIAARGFGDALVAAGF